MKDFVDHRMEKIMRTYLVTGGAGFIGSNYIHYMFRKYDNEIRIINVDVLTYAGNVITIPLCVQILQIKRQLQRFLQKMTLTAWYILRQRVM